ERGHRGIISRNDRPDNGHPLARAAAARGLLSRPPHRPVQPWQAHRPVWLSRRYRGSSVARRLLCRGSAMRTLAMLLLLVIAGPAAASVPKRSPRAAPRGKRRASPSHHAARAASSVRAPKTLPLAWWQFAVMTGKQERDLSIATEAGRFAQTVQDD